MGVRLAALRRGQLIGPASRPWTSWLCKLRHVPPPLEAVIPLQPVLDRRAKARLGPINDFGRQGELWAGRKTALSAYHPAVHIKAGATARSKCTSTSGTRTSSECAMLAQSASRRSWLRI